MNKAQLKAMINFVDYVEYVYYGVHGRTIYADTRSFKWIAERLIQNGYYLYDGKLCLDGAPVAYDSPQIRNIIHSL